MRHPCPYPPSGPITVLLAFLLSILLALSSTAQPTVQWEHYAGYASTAEFGEGLVRLSDHQLVSVGVWYPPTVGQTYYPLLTFTRPAGDTTRMTRLTALPDIVFTAVASADSGDFYCVGRTEYDSTHTTRFMVMGILCRFDSTGALKWTRYFQSGTTTEPQRVLAIPDGLLVTSIMGVTIQGAASTRAEVRRFDGRGRTRWLRTFGRDTQGHDLIALPDGAYALLTSDPNRFPAPHTFWDYDSKVYKLTASGDSLTSAYVGDSAAVEIGNRLTATIDGGLALVGKQSVQPSNTPRRGILFKLDANWHEQWRYFFAPMTGDYDRGGELYDVRELVNGHFLVTGLEKIRGQMNEVAAPGVGLWNWTPPAAAGGIVPIGRELLPDTATGVWRVIGTGSNQFPGMGRQDIWFASLTNLPAAATVNLCAVPPGVPVATYQPLAARADSLRFLLDGAATSAGPTYAEISRVTWQWGDGTPADTGRAVTHVFAAPTPVRVRCTITNNLFCTRSLDLFPFGPVTGVGLPESQELPTVSVYPNPSASGQFTVRLSGPATSAVTAQVVDAVGRSVWQGHLSGSETILHLNTQASGLYLLRLTWANGRSVSKKLWRP